MKALSLKNLFIFTFIVALAVWANGCASTPTKVETKLFDITTNTVIVVKTNTINRTNVEVQVVQQVVPTPSGSITNVVLFTNAYVIPVEIPVTNVTQHYTYVPNQNAVAIKETAGAVGGMFGVGGVASTLIMGIFGAWASWRSKQYKEAAVSLTQIIETGSELFKATPQGEKADAMWKNWMMKHQTEAGTIQTIWKILQTATDNQAAQKAATDIEKIITENPVATPPVPA